jgi:hypothetical protein
MSKEKEVVVTEKMNEIAVFDASLFEADAGKGMEGMGQDDLALPFLKVLSGNDPILDENEEARKGDIYNTVTGEVFKGKDGLRVIPCAYQRRFLQWAPRGSGTGAPTAIYTPSETRPLTVRSSEDNKDYVDDGSGEYIEETHQHFVLLVGDDGPTETVLISMKSTQLKKSRKWNSMMASRKMKGSNGSFTPPRFSHIYHLKTVSEENSKGSWHGWEMSCEGPITDADTYVSAKDFAESITSGAVVVKHTEEESTSSGSAPF